MSKEIKAVKKSARDFTSNDNKVKLACVGATAIAFSYIFLFVQGAGPAFFALAWLGMILCAPFCYDGLAYFLKKRKSDQYENRALSGLKRR